MYNTITVIGIGSLGSFVVSSISGLETVTKIICVDHDIVQEKNLKNSIYKDYDIGKLKVDALCDIINGRRDDLTAIGINKKFIEGETLLPDSDLVIDCRDYTYNRVEEIDVRLYLSSRYLIADCRKNVHYENQHRGKYLTELTRSDLRNAGSIFATLIDYDQISYLIRTKAVQRLELDYLNGFIKKKTDLIYDSNLGQDRLVNLPDNIQPIIDANKHSDINVCIGSKDNPISETIIPSGMLSTGNDVVSSLKSMLNYSNNFNNYVVCLSKKDNYHVIELVPETGAA